jgi:hypothetical protein
VQVSGTESVADRRLRRGYDRREYEGYAGEITLALEVAIVI